MNNSREFFDVRMRGFGERTDVETLWQMIDARVASLSAENVATHEAIGRTLAASVSSPVTLPAFDRAAMDGFALSASATPGKFTIVGEALPGRGRGVALAPGSALRIMTGAPLPPHANVVLPFEQAEVSGDELIVSSALRPWRHVSRRGEDVTEGEQVFSPGRVLRPQDLGLLASMGVSTVPVVRRPRVAILVTGKEILACGSKPEDYRVVDSNSIMLRALLERDGARVSGVRLLDDSPDDIRAALRACDEDLILVTGGSSVGAEDFAPSILASSGELLAHGVHLRPGAPLGFGVLGNRPVFLLPGNPVACLCAYDLIVVRAVQRISGQTFASPYPSALLPLADAIDSLAGRVDYVRVLLSEGSVHPLRAGAGSGASLLSSACRADGFVIVPAEVARVEAGNVVRVFLYDRPSADSPRP